MASAAFGPEYPVRLRAINGPSGVTQAVQCLAVEREGGGFPVTRWIPEVSFQRIQRLLPLMLCVYTAPDPLQRHEFVSILSLLFQQDGCCQDIKAESKDRRIRVTFSRGHASPSRAPCPMETLLDKHLV